MPIDVRIAPDGVREVRISGDSHVEQEASLLAWLLMRDHIQKIDRVLADAVKEPEERKSRERGRR